MSHPKSEITLAEWTKHYDRQAKIQGWSLFQDTRDETIRIQKIDDAANDGKEGDAQLTGDDMAMQVVWAAASNGDKGALLALFLDGKPVWDENHNRHPDLKYAKHWIPWNLK